MANKKISQLPQGTYRDYAMEAERRGVALLGETSLTPSAIILMGAFDLIRELDERIKALESKLDEINPRT